ncbi:MAG: rhodanese-like domain-containing protein [Sulfurimonas sp.]|nr:rhodanese-like domain-containing protein [Sulfurimonas sp.]
MKKIITLLLIFTISIFATVTNEKVSKKHINSNIPIVDIRTPGEWKQTGLLSGAIPIMFFDAQGKYNLDEFIEKLNKAVDTKKPFALICRSSSRTTMLSDFLSKNYKYQIINLKGGMNYAKSINLPIVSYK